MECTLLMAARLKKHWSREEAAEAIGIDHNTLYRWEAGKATPRGYNLRKLCDVYGMTAAELGFGEDKQTDSSEMYAMDSGLAEGTRTRPSNLSLTQNAERQEYPERIEDGVKRRELFQEGLRTGRKVVLGATILTTSLDLLSIDFLDRFCDMYLIPLSRSNWEMEYALR